MSFFSNSGPGSSYKTQAQVRVEGFHLPSPGTPPNDNPSGGNNHASTSGAGSNSGMNDLFAPSFHLPDAFRKFHHPSSGAEGFSDDLASLIGERSSSGQGQGNSNNGGSGAGYEDSYAHRTHNIFDVSSPIPVNNPHHSTSNANGAGSQPSSLHSPSTSLHDGYHHHPVPHHFNSTLPALNSSMRYEPPPESSSMSGTTSSGIPLTPSSPHQTSNPPPSSYHPPPSSSNTTATPTSFSRHTPSPTIHSSSHSHHGSVGSVSISNRSRSRSRPPSSGTAHPTSGLNVMNTGGLGPTRTTRTRRNNSVSGTSPPPIGRPHAILIPGRNGAPAHNGPLSAGAAAPPANPWFNSASEYSLPTPESLTSQSLHHHSHTNSQSVFGPFSLSPPPPSATSPGGAGSGNSDLSHHLPPLHHLAHSLPKSPLEQHPYGPSSYGFSNVNGPTSAGGSGNSPPGASPGSLPTSLGGGLGSPTAANGMAALAGNGYGGMGMMSIGGMHAGQPSSVNAPGQLGGAAGLNNVSSGIGPNAGGVTNPVDKQALIANEKRRRRRESHNAVERRRRDNINEKISELATLIPECMLDANTAPNAKDTGCSSTPPLTEDALVPHATRLASQQTPNPDNDGLKKEDDGLSGGIGTSAEGGAVVKANKGMILRKSVEYIRYLQQLVTAQGARNRELEQELKRYRGSAVSSPSGSSTNHPDVINSASNDNSNMEHTRQNSGSLTLVDDDDEGLDGGVIDDNMSLALDGDLNDSMVLHDEFGSPVVSSATLNSQSGGTSSNQAGNGSSIIKGSVTRKGLHKHSSSTSMSRTKHSRLPSMPEEDVGDEDDDDMEVDAKAVGGGGGGSGDGPGNDSPSSNNHESAPGLTGSDDPNNGELERGRDRGVRVGVQGMGMDGNGSLNEVGMDHSGHMGYGMMNGHHGQHQQYGHQVLGW